MEPTIVSTHALRIVEQVFISIKLLNSVNSAQHARTHKYLPNVQPMKIYSVNATKIITCHQTTHSLHAHSALLVQPRASTSQHSVLKIKIHSAHNVSTLFIAQVKTSKTKTNSHHHHKNKNMAKAHHHHKTKNIAKTKSWHLRKKTRKNLALCKKFNI